MSRARGSVPIQNGPRPSWEGGIKSSDGWGVGGSQGVRSRQEGRGETTRPGGREGKRPGLGRMKDADGAATPAGRAGRAAEARGGGASAGGPGVGAGPARG